MPVQRKCKPHACALILVADALSRLADGSTAARDGMTQAEMASSDTESDTASDMVESETEWGVDPMQCEAGSQRSSFAVVAIAVHFAQRLRALAASRYFHVHPELVESREEKGEMRSYVRLCSKCSTACDQRNGKAPEQSIANGRDYGRLHRLKLDRLSAAERVVLAPARTYGLVVKVRAWRLHSTPQHQMCRSR